MNSVGGEADPLQCRVRTLVLEQARLAKPASEKRDSAATMESIAGSAGRAGGSGTLGMGFDMTDIAQPNVGNQRVRWIDLLCLLAVMA
jgi:hypothetical protein